MDTAKDIGTASVKVLTADSNQNKAENIGTRRRGKTTKQLPNHVPRASGKNSANHWKGRLYFPKNDRGEASPHYAMQLQFKGRRMGFGLGTGNLEAAAAKAAGIYNDLLTLGIEGTLAKHRPQTSKPEAVATVGEWIAAAREVSEANDSTFNCYACSLRKIVGDILAVKRTKSRFGPKNGGAAGYRKQIDESSLEVLSLPAIQKWRIEYKKRAKTPAEERSRMTSCNSTIRQARSLFSSKTVYYIKGALILPTPAPFEIPPELKNDRKDNPLFFPEQSAKYFSRIDAKALIQKAHSELAEKDGPAFLAMLLALSAGLRRSEIDSLAWHQVDFTRHHIRIESTESASLKTTESRGEVPIDKHVVSILRGYHAKKTGIFVVEAEGEESGVRKWGHQYRADAVFTRLTAWLRKHGVKARKPLHELRKELGAMIATKHGIYAASQMLRHSDIKTTARHYSDQKERQIIEVGSWLTPEEGIIPFPSDQSEEETKKPARSRAKRAAHN